MNALLGWSIPFIILITGVAVVLYFMMGGIQAVIWTDAVQGIVLLVYFCKKTRNFEAAISVVLGLCVIAWITLLQRRFEELP